jgi:hypothetical protein
LRKRSGLSRWAFLAWLLNLLGVGGIIAVVVLYRAGRPAMAAPSAEESRGASAPSEGPLQQALDLATVTPNPLSTRIVGASPTPFSIGRGLRPAIVGFSVAGRPLELYTFGEGASHRMVVAGIHGGHEWNTIALADELIEFVADHPDIVPENTSLHFLRNLNPDGDARIHGPEGRVNDRGVDLNRNFPVNWEKDWEREGCWDLTPTSGGETPGSEPETQTLMNFIRVKHVEVLISYHSAALGVFPGGEPWQRDSIRFAKALSRTTGYPFPPLETGCHYTGTLADFAVSVGATAVDMELTNHRDTDFSENLEALQVLLEWQRGP